MRDWSFPVGVHELHEDTSLDFQLNRLATLGGGRLEEIREVAPRIRDLADWKREFLALADRAVSCLEPFGSLECLIRRDADSFAQLDERQWRKRKRHLDNVQELAIYCVFNRLHSADPLN